MRTSKNLLFHTWIGLKVKVLSSFYASQEGVEGIVIDETKNMLILETQKGTKKIQKVPCVFRFYCEDKKTVDVIGSKVCFRHYERPKKVL